MLARKYAGSRLRLGSRSVLPKLASVRKVLSSRRLTALRLASATQRPWEYKASSVAVRGGTRKGRCPTSGAKAPIRGLGKLGLMAGAKASEEKLRKIFAAVAV